MTITEYSPDLGPDNLPSFYRPPQRVTSEGLFKDLGRVVIGALRVINIFKPVKPLASHGDHFVPEPKPNHFEDGTGPHSEIHPDVHPNYVEAQH